MLPGLRSSGNMVEKKRNHTACCKLDSDNILIAAATTKKTIAILNLYDDTAHQHCTADEEELGGLLFIYHTLAP